MRILAEAVEEAPLRKLLTALRNVSLRHFSGKLL
jgi:hypothetical protein